MPYVSNPLIGLECERKMNKWATQVSGPLRFKSDLLNFEIRSRSEMHPRARTCDVHHSISRSISWSTGRLTEARGPVDLVWSPAPPSITLVFHEVHAAGSKTDRFPATNPHDHHPTYCTRTRTASRRSPGRKGTRRGRLGLRHARAKVRASDLSHRAKHYAESRRC